jgi:hypothetical protein
MAFQLKPGCQARGVQPEILLALQIIDGVYGILGVPLWDVTELTGSKHMTGSKHYIGQGADLRLPSRYVTQGGVDSAAARMMRERLGAEYDVVVESNHVHLEFDPDPKPV